MSVTIDEALRWATTHKHAVLITLRRDGRAQSSDIVYSVIEDAIVISLTATRAKTANMRRDPRIVLHITDPATWSYVSIDATAELGPVASDPHDSAANGLVDYYRRVTGSDHPDWHEYRTAMVAEQRQLLWVRPNGVVGQINS